MAKTPSEDYAAVNRAWNGWGIEEQRLWLRTIREFDPPEERERPAGFDAALDAWGRMDFGEQTAFHRAALRAMEVTVHPLDRPEAPSRHALLNSLPEGEFRGAVARAAKTGDGGRLAAARELSGIDEWKTAASGERAVAVELLTTRMERDGRGLPVLKPVPFGVRAAVKSVLGAPSVNPGLWTDPEGASPLVAPLEPDDPIDWEAPAERRKWLVNGLVPFGRVSAIYGPGEAGKSRLMLQIALAVMTGRGTPALPTFEGGGAVEGLPAVGGWLGEHGRAEGGWDAGGRVLLVTWEDEAEEFHRRYELLRNAGGLPAGFDPRLMRERLSTFNMRDHGSDALWAPRRDGTRHTSTEGAWTPTGRALLARIEADKPSLVIIDPIAAAFASSEVDRALVRAFISAFDAAAEDCGEHGATVLLVGHPPKTDAKFSGSTDWRNGVRGMLLIEWLDVTVDVKHGKNGEAVGYEIAKVPALVGDKSNYSRKRGPIWLVNDYEPEDRRRGEPEKLGWFAARMSEAAHDPHVERVFSKKPAARFHACDMGGEDDQGGGQDDAQEEIKRKARKAGY